MVRTAARNLPEQNKNNKCVNRPPGTAVKNTQVLMIYRVLSFPAPDLIVCIYQGMKIAA